MTKSHPFAQIGYAIIWLAIAVVAALVAWQLHVTTVFLTTLLVESPLRPHGWSSGSVVSLSRLSIVVWGAAWLMYIYYVEYQLRQSIQRNNLLRRSGRYMGILLVLYTICYLILLV